MTEHNLHHLDRRWRYMLRAYYAADVKPPKRPGDLAIETVHASESSMQMERDVMERRSDIGSVVLIERGSRD